MSSAVEHSEICIDYIGGYCLEACKLYPSCYIKSKRNCLFYHGCEGCVIRDVCVEEKIYE